MFLLFQHPCILATFIILFSYTFIHHNFGHSKGRKLPPGSFGWCPFIGQTLSFIAPHISSSRGRFLDHSIKQYGKIFRSHVFGHPTIISCDAEFNSFILNNEDRLFTSSYPKNIPGVLGDLTLLVVTGDAHKRLRGVALNLFATMRIHNSSFLSDIEDNVTRVMGYWENKQTLVFCAEARKFTFSVIVKQILSLGPEDPKTTEILDNFTTFMRGLVSIPINLPGTPYAKAIQAKHRIKAIVKAIRQHREKEVREIVGRADYLDALLAHDEVSDEEILSLVIDLLLGGYETTSMLLANIIYFLGGNSKAMIDLREEHLSVQKQVGDGYLGWEDYKNMPFTQGVINEALRLGNIVKFVHRKAVKPIHYKGYEIPAGWKFLPIFSGVHLDPSLHSDPFRFDPWRWQGLDTSTAKNFMPFGGGRRLCPGSELARLETSFFLHHLVLNFSWELLEDERAMSLPYTDFKNGLQISVHPVVPLK